MKQTYGVEDADLFRRKLEATKAPCLDNTEFWYDTLECPQLTADTYGRAVVLFATVPQIEKDGSIRKKQRWSNYKHSQAFVPSSFLDPAALIQPDHSISYQLAFLSNQSTKNVMKSTTSPQINSLHKVANICPIDFSTAYQTFSFTMHNFILSSNSIIYFIHSILFYKNPINIVLKQTKFGADKKNSCSFET